MLKMELVLPPEYAPQTPRVGVKLFRDATSDQLVDEDFPVFDISTYRKVTNQSASTASICELNNRFFATLTPDEQVRFYEYFKAMKGHLNNLTRDTLQADIRQMTDLTENVFLQMNIPQRLIDFVKDIDVPFQSFENKIKRIQDSDAKTFYRDEYVVVTAISVMCKILSPILGESISKLKPPITDKENKEYHTFLIFEPVLALESSPFHAVYKKLRYYLVTTIMATLDNRNNNPNNSHSSLSFSMGDNGFCDRRFVDLICAIVMTKKLVTFDIFKTEVVGKTPNIMTYIYVVTFETADSKLSTVQSGTNRMPRFDPTDGSGQEDNTTQLENTARISKVSFDIPVMAEVAVDMATEKIIQNNGLDKTMVERIVNYYRKNLLTPSPFNRGILASLFGKMIGGSPTLLYLNMVTYARLVACAQLIMIKQGFSELVTLLSSATPATPRADPITSSASRILSNYNKTYEYLECVKMFPGFSEKVTEGRSETGRRIQESEFISVDAQLARLVKWLVDYDHFCNMPPILWKQMGVSDEMRLVQGDLLPLDENIMRVVCRFIQVCHTPKGDDPCPSTAS